MSNSREGISDTLLTQESQQRDNRSRHQSDRMTLLVSIIIIVLLALIIVVIILSYSLNKDKVPPVSIKLPLLDDRQTTMKVGTSRVLQVLFFSGNDDRTSDDFRSVTQKQVRWRVDPAGVIAVDSYGRVEALSTGTAAITVTSVYDNKIRDTKTIQVVTYQKTVSNATRIINCIGPPRKIPPNLQKVVQRYTKQQVEASDLVPTSIKQVSAHPDTSTKKNTIEEQGVLWEIVPYADKTNRSYLKRTQGGASVRDKEQYFIGNRYLPGNGDKIISIETDGNNGIWTVQENGTVTNIQMVPMSNNHKAEIMTVDTEKYVMRHGFASDAQWNGSAWKPSVSDNDGLWTGMFCAGQFMKYASMKRYKVSEEEVKLSRNRAIKSLKAVLMNAHVSGRNGTVDAKIRHFNSSKNQVYLSSSYLKKGKSYKIESYPKSPAEGIGFFGQGAGSIEDGVPYSGTQRYTFKPYNPDDWTLNEEPTTTKRTLNHYLARSFVIPALEGNISWGGLFFQRNYNGTQTVLSGANNLYDYTSSDHPVLNLGNLDLPDALKTIEEIDGRPLKPSDLVYKGDTSSDTLIGHLFLYKIAFDILDESDQQEKQLKQLVAETLAGFAQMFINNGYNHVDATGQGTKWMRMTRDFFNSDYTLEDSPLKALQTLLVFKLAYYVTGDLQWKDQYDLLVKHQSFKYADLTSTLWDRWIWQSFNEDVSPSDKRYRLNFTREEIDQVELVRHVMYNDHYSDDEEAMLAYYLIFQLEEDLSLLFKYKAGLKGYWQTIRRSESALWYLIYQLTEPNNTQSRDYFGNNLVETAAWALSRHPIDTVTYTAYIPGSRPDVIYEGQLSVNPLKEIGSRKSSLDAAYVNLTKNYEIAASFDPMKIYQIHPLPQDERSVHKYNAPTFTNIQRGNPKNRQAATIFTLPYWLGVYHNMIAFDR